MSSQGSGGGVVCMCLGLLHILKHTWAVIENKFVIKVLISLLEGFICILKRLVSQLCSSPKGRFHQFVQPCIQQEVPAA